MKEENVYERHGFNDRDEYLADLADCNGIDMATVQMVADMLGENEDFDGLVTTLEDYAMMPY